jgi:hypothetical protein
MQVIQIFELKSGFLEKNSCDFGCPLKYRTQPGCPGLRIKKISWYGNCLLFKVYLYLFILHAALMSNV